MNELGWAEMPTPPLKRPRWEAPTWMAVIPHIYFKDGYWRVTRASSKKLITIALYNRAHDHVARLNNQPNRGIPT